LAAARASFLSLPPLVCHDKSIASNTHNRVIDKKKLIKLVLPTRILRMISWVLTATKTQALEFTFKLDLRNLESVHQSVLMKTATSTKVASFG
jgi:hypothetical protein